MKITQGIRKTSTLLDVYCLVVSAISILTLQSNVFPLSSDYTVTRSHILEDGNLHNYRRDCTPPELYFYAEMEYKNVCTCEHGVAKCDQLRMKETEAYELKYGLTSANSFMISHVTFLKQK
jgi:hypothetical protein